MADHLLQNSKQPLSLADINPNNDFMNHYSGQNPGHQVTSGLNFDSLLGYPHDSMFPQLPECLGNQESFTGFFSHEEKQNIPSVMEPTISSEHSHKDRKQKGLMDISVPERSAYSSPQASNNRNRKTSLAGRGKKVNVEDEKRREVIHVRAKRGQATDSHSLAERVRRGKINDRLRCLQDIVPGCYKTMGMAVMLDEIISYVRSLQNQVEFLSMKLTAASTYNDFNSDTDAIETMQRVKAFEALKVQNAASQGLPSAQFAPLGPNFGYYPHLPHNR